MRLINNTSLLRGELLIDHAFRGTDTLCPTVSDLVGLVAAYLDLRDDAVDMEEELKEKFGPHTARRAREVYELFEDWEGRALWQEGGAVDDVRFTHPTLISRFPGLNQRQEALAA